MTDAISPNAQAILLLTAPLIAGGRVPSAPDPLTPGEYRRLARWLFDRQREPADLLSPGASELLAEDRQAVDSGRIERLLARGFLLAQALERWRARGIWVVSRADPEYPARLKARLKEQAPAVLYGCGRAALWETGGLGVVGSRHVSEALVEYTKAVGRLAARARRTLVSGGARGIDQAAMRGALAAGGQAVGVLAEGLERAALNHENRGFLLDERLLLISPYDPAAGFNVGNAMRRNKLIYALADAALVVSSDHEKGGTWAGATEQLEHLKLVPVYVRTTGETGSGLEALHGKGALPWPEPATPEELDAALAVPSPYPPQQVEQQQLSFAI